MDITIILSSVGTVAAISGINIALISWLRSDMKSFEGEIRGWKDEMQKESKDFHGRMERMDCEFKMRMTAMEERKKK